MRKNYWDFPKFTLSHSSYYWLCKISKRQKLHNFLSLSPHNSALQRLENSSKSSGLRITAGFLSLFFWLLASSSLDCIAIKTLRTITIKMKPRMRASSLLQRLSLTQRRPRHWTIRKWKKHQKFWQHLTLKNPFNSSHLKMYLLIQRILIYVYKRIIVIKSLSLHLWNY